MQRLRRKVSSDAHIRAGCGQRHMALVPQLLCVSVERSPARGALLVQPPASRPLQGVSQEGTQKDLQLAENCREQVGPPASRGPNAILDAALRAADTGWAMSQENVEIVRRVSDAYNRRDVGAMLDELHPEVEWHPWLQLQLGGEATVYRGHEGVRKGVREVEEAFSEIQAEQTEIRDLGERVVAIGHLRGRGSESGAITESAIAWIVEFKSGKVIRVREYLDPKKALEAVGLSE